LSLPPHPAGSPSPPCVPCAHDWQSPIWRPICHPVIEEFSRSFTFWRDDQRGNGLSDRGPKDVSLEAMVDDLTVAADAAGLDGFTLYRTSQGAPIAI
jgi:pimeloyl-ACP methyl ester carboxylesterase